MQPAGVSSAEWQKKMEAFEAAEKKKYDDAVAAKNCELLDNPTTFYKCKDKLKNVANEEADTAQKAHEVMGKLSPLLNR